MTADMPQRQIVAMGGGGFSIALSCLGFLPGSFVAHDDSEPVIRREYHRLLAAGAIRGGYAVDDGVALHFVGTRLTQVVSSRAGARAFRVEQTGDSVNETLLEPTHLPAR